MSSSDSLTVAGDVHHIFPKEYLKQSGITDKSRYNQVANYAFLDTGVNISIGKSTPHEYFSAALAQCEKDKWTLAYVKVTLMRQSINPNSRRAYKTLRFSLLDGRKIHDSGVKYNWIII